MLTGDMLDVLPTLPPDCISVAPFSPPYWQVRDYGVAPRVWSGDPSCSHEWGDDLPAFKPGQVAQTKWKNTNHVAQGQQQKSGRFCQKCGAWLGTLGQEPDPRLYVEHIVECLRAVKRVLHPMGTVWLNVADTFSGGKSGNTNGTSSSSLGSARQTSEKYGAMAHRKPVGAIPAKNMCLIPERLAIALQDDGWWVRSRITWAKTAAMPSSVEDRPTPSTEPIFLLAKRPTYFYDPLAVKERAVSSHGSGNGYARAKQEQRGGRGQSAPWEPTAERRLRDLWVIGPDPMTEIEHAAPWPLEVPRRCILLGTSERGYCPSCLTPWRRVTERSGAKYADEQARSRQVRVTNGAISGGTGRTTIAGVPPAMVVTTAWEPICRCDAGDPVPGIVLDPFSGTGRTLEAALAIGLRAIGVELNATWSEQSRRRLAQWHGPHMFAL